MTEVLLKVTILVDKNIVKHILWEGKLKDTWADAFNLESPIWSKLVDTALINQGDSVAIGEILYISECTFRFTL